MPQSSARYVEGQSGHPVMSFHPKVADPENPGTGAALYLRVSTGRQAESDLSIPDQRRQALAFCKAKGWEVVVEFVEPGASGTDDRRPELQRLLDMATAGDAPFDAVVVIPLAASPAIILRLNAMYAACVRRAYASSALRRTSATIR
jgi:Resolvase, N terminal domain